MNKTIFITGATDGIGLALAKLYAGQQTQLILLGRRPANTLTDSLFEEHPYCQVDLVEPDCGQQVANFLQEQGIEQIDMVIHNAGIGYYGDIASQTMESIEQVLAVNLLAPIRLTHVFLPYLKKSRGQLVFISSVVTAMPAPSYAVYGASKAALDGFARSLRVELAGQVKVQVIHPGATHTNMHQKLGITQREMDWEKFPPVEQVVSQIQRAIAKGHRTATIGLTNQLLRLVGLWGRWGIDPLLKRKEKVRPLLPAANAQDPPLCVITGAAQGIGKALAYRFGQTGYRIIGIDWDQTHSTSTQKELTEAGIDIEFRQADLGQPSGIQEIVATLAHLPPIHVLVHNAGISAVGRFGRVEMPAQEAVLNINLRAPLQLTAGLWQAGCLAEDITVVFMSSLSYYASYPGASVYGASKDGLAHYARSLHVALGKAGNTLTVYPGPTRTDHARRYSPDNSREEKRMPPERVAQLVWQAVKAGKRQLIPGMGNQVMAIAGKLFPRLLESGMKKIILDKLD